VVSRKAFLPRNGHRFLPRSTSAWQHPTRSNQPSKRPHKNSPVVFCRNAAPVTPVLMPEQIASLSTLSRAQFGIKGAAYRLEVSGWLFRTLLRAGFWSKRFGIGSVITHYDAPKENREINPSGMVG
jgi:hypothetical protein